MDKYVKEERIAGIGAAFKRATIGTCTKLSASEH
jgi:hypothetical protein